MSSVVYDKACLPNKKYTDHINQKILHSAIFARKRFYFPIALPVERSSYICYTNFPSGPVIISWK